MASLDSTVRIPDDVLFQDLEGEAVILNPSTGKYYGLNGMGTRMWALLAEHGRIEPAYQALLNEFDVTEDRLRQELLGFVRELAAQRLLQVDAP